MYNKNFQQAKERKQREAENAQKELQDKLTEIKNNIFGDTLTENPEVAMSAFGSHRVITDRWKVNYKTFHKIFIFLGDVACADSKYPRNQRKTS